jgi:hypothetical protein
MNAAPKLSWLPATFSRTSRAMSQGRTLPSVRTVPSRPPYPSVTYHPNPYRGMFHPNPNGIDSHLFGWHPPIPYAMGGPPSYSTYSPLTTDFDVSVYGGSRNASQHGGFHHHRAPLHDAPAVGGQSIGGRSVISLGAGSLLPTSLDSSETSLTSSMAKQSVPALAPPTKDVSVKSEVPTIKDKPSDFSIKPINDKESWLNANKIIESHLCHPPYWSGPSGDLITMDANIAASVWWEEVIDFFCKPPVSDLFVGETRFDRMGFKRINYINRYFHPSGAVNSLGYIFDLIDIRQKTEELVVSLKARFSQAFSSLKLGGIGIDSALQVGFMLRTLSGHYHLVVEEFCLGRHPLSKASLETVVDQCVNFDKDTRSSALSARLARLSGTRLQMQREPPLEIARMHTKPLQLSCSTTILAAGRRPSERTQASVCSAMIPPTTPTTKATTARSSRNLVLNWRREPAWTTPAVMPHLV